MRKTRILSTTPLQCTGVNNTTICGIQYTFSTPYFSYQSLSTLFAPIASIHMRSRLPMPFGSTTWTGEHTRALQVGDPIFEHRGNDREAVVVAYVLQYQRARRFPGHPTWLLICDAKERVFMSTTGARHGA